MKWVRQVWIYLKMAALIAVVGMTISANNGTATVLGLPSKIFTINKLSVYKDKTKVMVVGATQGTFAQIETVEGELVATKNTILKEGDAVLVEGDKTNPISITLVDSSLPLKPTITIMVIVTIDKAGQSIVGVS